MIAQIKAAVTRLLERDVRHPKQWSYLSWLLPNTTIDFSKHVGDGQGSNVFMSPILWVWRASLEARLGVLTETKDSDEIDRQHDLAQLLNEPNPFTTGAALRLAIWISWFTDGNCYLLKARDASGRVRQLWYTPHWMIEPKWDESKKGDFISHYEYKPDGETVELAPSEVIHLRHGVDPRNVRKGFSYMKMLLREIFNDDEAANFVAALLLNGGVPGVVISPKDGAAASTEDLKATKAYIKAQFGRSKRGEPLALGAPTDVKEFGYDPSKMNLDVVRNVSEERVCAALGLPAAVVGFGSGMEQTKVGATLIELHRIAWIDCLIPNQDLLAEEFTRALREDFKFKPNQRVGWDRDNVRALQDDRNKESERLVRLVSGAIMKRAEARKRLRLEVTPEDDVYHVPLGITFEGPGAPEPEPMEEVELDENGQPLPPKKKPKPGDKQPPVEKPKAARARLSKTQTQILRAMDKLKVAAEKRLRERMADFLAKVGEAARTAYLEQAAKAEEDALRVELVFSNMNLPRLKSELRGIMGSHFVTVHRESVNILSGVGIGVNLPDSVELEVLAMGGTRAGMVDLSRNARAKALKIIEEGRTEGRNPIDIARDLAEAVPAGHLSSPRARAELIARTETRVAQTESALRTYRATEGIDQVVIIDGRLGETDEDCEEINGQRVSFEEAQALLAAEHPNGTRDLVPAFRR